MLLRNKFQLKVEILYLLTCWDIANCVVMQTYVHYGFRDIRLLLGIACFKICCHQYCFHYLSIYFSHMPLRLSVWILRSKLQIAMSLCRWRALSTRYRNMHWLAVSSWLVWGQLSRWISICKQMKLKSHYTHTNKQIHTPLPVSASKRGPRTQASAVSRHTVDLLWHGTIQWPR